MDGDVKEFVEGKVEQFADGQYGAGVKVKGKWWNEPKGKGLLKAELKGKNVRLTVGKEGKYDKVQAVEVLPDSVLGIRAFPTGSSSLVEGLGKEYRPCLEEALEIAGEFESEVKLGPEQIVAVAAALWIERCKRLAR